MIFYVPVPVGCVVSVPLTSSLSDLGVNDSLLAFSFLLYSSRKDLSPKLKRIQPLGRKNSEKIASLRLYVDTSSNLKAHGTKWRLLHDSCANAGILF